MTPLWITLHALWLTALIEGLTVLARFGLRWESQHMTRSTVGRLSFGWRIHHGYLILPLAIAAALMWSSMPMLAGWTLALGIAMLLSDLIHHFVVLHRWAGYHEWYWRYPEPALIPIPVEDERLKHRAEQTQEAFREPADD